MTQSTEVAPLEALAPERFENSALPTAAASAYAAIRAMEAQMLAMPEAQIHIEPTHSFCEGVYAREVLIPKGTLLVSKAHRKGQFNVMLTGRMTIMNDQGEFQDVTAPMTSISKPGMKRIGFAHEDTRWITYHATQETDIEAVERELILPEPSLLAAEKLISEEP